MISKILLNNGHTIPQIGLGTWRITGIEKVKIVLKSAIDLGYRHIDTAYVYENEKEIGNALSSFYKANLIKREDLFITSKLWNSFHDRAEEGLIQTLKDLQTEYLDLYLIHWSVNFSYDEKGNSRKDKNGNFILNKFDLEKIWRKMEEFVDRGFVRSIGVSNFGIENLSKLMKICRIKPVINQVEMHPFLKQNEIIEFCERNDIRITSYSSLGSQPVPDEMGVLDCEIICKISKEYNVSPSCVILSWLVQKGVIIIPKASSENHLNENINTIKLSDDNVRDLNKHP